MILHNTVTVRKVSIETLTIGNGQKEGRGDPNEEDCSFSMRLPKYEAMFDQKSFYNEYSLPLFDWNQFWFLFQMFIAFLFLSENTFISSSGDGVFFWGGGGWGWRRLECMISFTKWQPFVTEEAPFQVSND